MEATREVLDPAGERWEATVISHGRTSEYLNAKVHRPIVQFACRTRRLPVRYAPLPHACATLTEMSDAALHDLLTLAKAH